jgi:hypothetical protein
MPSRESNYSLSDEDLDKKFEINNPIDDPFADLDLSPSTTVESDEEIIAALLSDGPAAWSKKVTEPKPKAASKKVIRRLRRSDVLDMQTLNRILQFRVPTISTAGVPLVRVYTPSNPSLIPDPLDAPSPSPLAPDNDNAIPVWGNSQDRVKLAASTWALEASGKPPVSWTLNLTPERIDEAQRDPRGFTKSLQRDLNRALERELGVVPLYWFSVDATRKPDQRLHLHGAVAADAQDLPGIERALRHVGGHGPKPAKPDFMVDFNAQRCDEGWSNYSMRNAGQVRKLIKGRTISITGALRSKGRWFYEEVRRIMPR